MSQQHKLQAQDVSAVKVLIHIAFYTFAMVANTVTSRMAFSSHANLHRPLHDRIHDLFPQFDLTDPSSPMHALPDTILVSLCVIGILLIASHSASLAEVSATALSWLKIHGIILFMRCPTIVLTTLPSPIAACYGVDQPLSPPGFLIEIMCNDCIFSGHTATNVLIGMFCWYMRRIHIAFRILLWIGIGFAAVISIASRDHYSVDVVVAIYVSGLIGFAFRDEIIRHVIHHRPDRNSVL